MHKKESSCELRTHDLALRSPSGVQLLEPSTFVFPIGVSALLAANGSGKSTLLRALATAYPLSKGSITLDGLDSCRDKLAYLRKIVFMPQNFVAYPDLTGAEFLQYGLRCRGANRQQAKEISAEWLQDVHLSHVANVATGAYSPGMLQRLGLAYAAQLDVDVYLLDEPFAGVDDESVEKLADILFAMASQKTLVVSSHQAHHLIRRGATQVHLDGRQLCRV